MREEITPYFSVQYVSFAARGHCIQQKMSTECGGQEPLLSCLELQRVCIKPDRLEALTPRVTINSALTLSWLLTGGDLRDDYNL